MTGIGGSGPEPRDDLTKLTVNLTPDARAALEKAAALTGMTRTDCLNRALLLYAEVEQIARQHDGNYRISWPDWDDRGGLEVVVGRQARRRWSPW